MSTMKYLLFGLVLWLNLSLVTALGGNSATRIYQNDITSLIFNKNQLTTSRRVAPMNQLQCTTGCSLANLNRVVCTNAGNNGFNINWKCDTELPNNVRFGQLAVSCEGYESPADRYVLAGSCGLKYGLEYINTNGYTPRDRSNDLSGFFVCVFIVLLLVVYSVQHVPYYATTTYMPRYVATYPVYQSSYGGSGYGGNTSSSSSSSTRRVTDYATTENR